MISDHVYELAKSNWLGEFMRSQKWAFASAEALHFIGLSLLVGAMMIVDLRLLGFMKSMSYRVAFKFLPVAILGFAINVVTGVMFIVTEPRNYGTNPAFWIKMALIALGGLNALWFTLVEHRRVSALPQGQSVDAASKAAAALSLLLWIAVITAGRLLPTFASPEGGGIG